MNKRVSVSAPGKLMVMGEHAVVYGFPCIVTAVDRRLTVTAEATGTELVIDAPQAKDTRFVEEAVRQVNAAGIVVPDGMRIATESAFSSSYGFGSSSAVSVGVVAAIMALAGEHPDKRRIFDIAYKTVLAVQGVGSGFDVASAAYGGTMVYVKGGGTLTSLAWKGGEPVFVVGYSGVKADTATIVRDVAAKRERYPERVNRLFAGIAQLVGQAAEAYAAGDAERFGKLMTFNQEYLRDLGVSTPKLEAMIDAANAAGAYGAKLSGAGGGDCMIALVPIEKKAAVEAAIRGAGGAVIVVATGAPGVRAATTDDQDELFTVVDEQDNEVGVRTRSECHGDPTLIHRTVGVAVFDSAGRLLLQKRSMTKDMEAGLWGISAAGHVGVGEAYEKAASRELAEELGISAPLVFRTKFLARTPGETEMAAIFTCTSDGPFTVNRDETDRTDFFTKDVLVRGMLSGDIRLTVSSEMALKAIGFL